MLVVGGLVLPLGNHQLHLCLATFLVLLWYMHQRHVYVHNKPSFRVFLLPSPSLFQDVPLFPLIIASGSIFLFLCKAEVAGSCGEHGTHSSKRLEEDGDAGAGKWLDICCSILFRWKDFKGSSASELTNFAADTLKYWWYVSPSFIRIWCTKVLNSPFLTLLAFGGCKSHLLLFSLCFSSSNKSNMHKSSSSSSYHSSSSSVNTKCTTSFSLILVLSWLRTNWNSAEILSVLLYCLTSRLELPPWAWLDIPVHMWCVHWQGILDSKSFCPYQIVWPISFHCLL